MEMKKMSRHTLKELDGRTAIIELCSGALKSGQEFYAYVAVYPSRYETYLTAFENGATVNLPAFGTVLKCGVGREPPEEIKRQMEKDYGLSHRFETDLHQALTNGERA